MHASPCMNALLPEAIRAASTALSLWAARSTCPDCLCSPNLACGHNTCPLQAVAPTETYAVGATYDQTPTGDLIYCATPPLQNATPLRHAGANRWSAQLAISLNGQQYSAVPREAFAPGTSPAFDPSVAAASSCLSPVGRAPPPSPPSMRTRPRGSASARSRSGASRRPRKRASGC